MIISASRRTDIPAFFSKWFFNRLAAGYCHVRNPYNPSQVSLVDLSNPEGMVFWTKNPGPMLDRLHSLDFPFYFQFTVTGYADDIEKHNIPLPSRLKTFECLANEIGSDRIIWRYDPILITDIHTVSWHVETFKSLAFALSGMTKRCVVSFLDQYKGIPSHLRSPATRDMRNILQGILPFAKQYGFSLATCAENIDFPEIAHSRCIDPDLLTKIAGTPVKAAKDPSQREACGCAKSRDIGAYSTCRNGCLYCYAMSGTALPHDPESSVIDGVYDHKPLPRPIKPGAKQGRLL